MLRWIRYITLIVISGAAYAAPEINIKQSESSLPDLASETAQQEEQRQIFQGTWCQLRYRVRPAGL